ncbi:MAG TPA: RNA-binding S4 domain-containing protein [Chromatiales bacterium]|nr:RNA-binding S4 domain-containing protein [Chromatiales bacterium]
MPATSQPDRLRLDKWLWAARFFKTRQLASEAITGGKVHLDGHRTKPGKEVRIGSRLRIHKGPLEWDIEVTGISKQRRPAKEAALLYHESEESLQHRQRIVEERRRDRDARRTGPRPSKRDRRQIHRFVHRSGE